MSVTLDNSSGSTKRAALFALAVAGVAVVLYLFAVQPCQDSIAKARSELDSLEGQLRVTTRDLKDSPRVKNMLAEIETARQPFLDALLTPLLESWAFRAMLLLRSSLSFPASLSMGTCCLTALQLLRLIILRLFHFSGLQPAFWQPFSR